MLQKKNIIWLASYPKSGNTWFRIFLSHLLFPEKEFSINNLHGTPIASSRELFEEATGLDSTELNNEEIDLMRPDVYRYHAINSENPFFLKVHDAYTNLPNQSPLFPTDCSKGVIYFLRNPLDVAVSFSYHAATETTKAASNMNNDSFCFAKSKFRPSNQLRQKLLSWSNHVISWTEQNKIPVHVMKYEDMLNDPFATFKKAIAFCGLPHSDDDILHALEMSSFEKLQEQETQNGFREKPLKMESFFRSGKVGTWKEQLDHQTIELILQNHKETIQNHYGNSSTTF